MSGDPAATAASLVLAPDQVPLGATIYLLDPATGRPVEADGKRANPYIHLYSTGGMTATFCSVNERGDLGGPHDNVLPEARFIPVEAYVVGEAPPGPEYAVFVNGGRHTVAGDFVNVTVHQDGRMTDSVDRLSIMLPQGAILVPIDDGSSTTG